MSAALINSLQRYIKQHRLFTESDLLLVTVSGGVDSMVLLHSLLNLKYRCIVAHCNFGLRGAESDGDEQLVTSFCASHQIPLQTIRFETQTYAKQHKLSIQMAARELRYDWFRKTAHETGCTRIAVAHNANDVAETFFLNLTRGAGLRGLGGIAVTNDKIVRPLLFATRTEILAYAREFNIVFREDSSNSSDKYHRNRIRHRVIPELETINPAFIKNVGLTTTRLTELSDWLDGQLQNLREQVIEKRTDGMLAISIPQLKASQMSHTLLFEILSDFGFSSATIRDIDQTLDAESGKQFYSPEYRVVKDRDELIISPIADEPVTRFYLNESDSQIDSPIKMNLSIVDASQFTLIKNPRIACLDADKLSFPLLARRWKQGDYFVPLGMTQLKKVSDFFIDAKVSLVDKESAWIIDSGGTIAWIAGYRIDDRFKVTPETRRVLILEILD